MGETGVLAMDELIVYRNELNKNIHDLKERHSLLSQTMDQLHSDEKVVELRARSLDFYKEDEKVFRMKGWNRDQSQAYQPGRVIRYRKRHSFTGFVYRGAAAAVGLFVYLLLTGVLFVGTAKNRSKSRPSQRLSS